MREPSAGAVRETRAQRLHLADAWTWSREQAAALRRRDFGAVDWDSVIEEIEDAGNRHSDIWTWCCTSVISHLLIQEHSGSVRRLGPSRKRMSRPGAYR